MPDWSQTNRTEQMLRLLLLLPVCSLCSHLRSGAVQPGGPSRRGPLAAAGGRAHTRPGGRPPGLIHRLPSAGFRRHPGAGRAACALGGTAGGMPRAGLSRSYQKNTAKGCTHCSKTCFCQPVESICLYTRLCASSPHRKPDFSLRMLCQLQFLLVAHHEVRQPALVCWRCRQRSSSGTPLPCKHLTSNCSVHSPAGTGLEKAQK